MEIQRVQKAEKTLVAATRLTQEMADAIALLVGQLGGTVKFPCMGVSHEVKQQLAALFQPAGIKVTHGAKAGPTSPVNGMRFLVEFLHFQSATPNALTLTEEVDR